MGRAAYVKFYDTHQEVVDAMRKLSKEALRAGGKVVMKKLKADTPKVTGKAKKLITQWARIDRNTGQPRLDIGYYSAKTARKRKGINLPSNYVALMEKGTGAHAIRAGVKSSRGKVRKTTGKRLLTNGVVVFGRSVRHPGAQPQPILKTAVMNGIPEIRAAMVTKLSELNKTIDRIKTNGEEAVDDG